MRHVEQEIPVTVIIVTDGAFGLDTEESSAYILQRQQESIAAAKILGYGTPQFWNYSDRQVTYNEKFVQEILKTIQDSKADLIYAPSVFEMHPDHRIIGMAVVEAVRRMGKDTHIALYEIGMPMRPNRLLDITDLIERKATAMSCFTSQNTRQRYDLHIAALNRYRSYTLPASVTAAEAYILLSAEELTQDPLKLYQSEYSRQKALGLVLDDRDIPLVSIIIRSLGRPTLSDALDSVALQTYSKIEVIIVNAKGIGHHNVGDWCGNFPQRLISDSDSPLHRSRAGNVGMKASNGDYLLFLDDDDWLAPDHITKLVNSLINHPSYLAAHTGIACVDEEKQPTSITFEQPCNIELLTASNYMPIHSVLFSRAIIECGCEMDETLDLYEDWDFWLQVSQFTEFFFTPGISGYYRIHQSSKIHRQKVFFGSSYARIYEKWRKRWSTEHLSQLMYNYNQMHFSILQLEKDLINVREALSNTQTELSNTQIQLSTTQTQLLNVQAQRTDIQTQLTDTQTQLTDAHHQATKVQTQLSISKNELDIMRQSRSWRITSPLRNFNLIIRKILNRL